ncbi:MAG: hypothetical protein JWN79_3395, partial [Gemmatimonadetes bacterium]|nr:hypothetical protein [Gemmatimonadota bacterium]
FGGDLLEFEIPDQRSRGPREVAPREVLRAPAPPAAPARPAFDDLPMLDDGPPEDGEDTSFGGDLQLIMPDDEDSAADVAAARRRPEPSALDDIPLMDLDLPMSGEASARISGAPVPGLGDDELEMIDLSAPSSAPPAYERQAEVPQPAAAELSPAELDVRAELDLDVPPIVRELAPSSATPEAYEAGGDAVQETPDSGSFIAIPEHTRPTSTIMAAHSVEMLQAEVDTDPEDYGLRRRLGEVMLESGDREGGMRELEAAMIGFERTDDLSSAASLADEIVLLNPGSVRHHQKRVEYAFRTNERGRLIEAYLQLADALFRVDQLEKSRAIYQRVLDLSPDDLRANAALESFPAEEVAPAPAPAPKGRPSTAIPRPAAPLKPIVTSDDEFVNLGDWLRDDAAPKDTRMVVEEKEPTGDEEADFQDMLRKFKQGIAENVEDEDHQSHYDLGVAYKEMGLLDEAIAEFQKALRGPANRVSTYEALGQCFIEKEQYPMAATILGRAAAEKGVSDDQLVGVLYLLGVAAEQRGQLDLASQYYQRVFVIDIQFRDVGDRLAAVEGAS